MPSEVTLCLTSIFSDAKHITQSLHHIKHLLDEPESNRFVLPERVMLGEAKLSPDIT